MPKKLKIAVTGGIGSGKSTVCDIFRSHGYPVLNADQISKEILSTSQKVKEKIISHFGKDSFENDKPNKEYLADKVFNNQEKLKVLNSILHPPTIEKISNEMQKFLITKKIVFVEAALIYEANMEDMFNHVLMVASPESNRIERIKRGTELMKRKLKI
ncbi:MAG: dephospho-CoA kinase [Melioribacteraceae bacterium]|nr:dephospho-CoA kinase [Melioribacteraceae bacterium]